MKLLFTYLQIRTDFFFEERLLIDAPRLKNIAINFSDMHEDNTEYYANYDYLDKLKKQQ